MTMNKPKHYKKHIKPVTDLFRIPKDEPGIHISFDSRYHMTRRSHFAASQSQRVTADIFSPNDRNDYPIPQLGISTTSNDNAETDDNIPFAEPMATASRRPFLSFPSGFWAEMSAAESSPFVIGGLRNGQ
jgi:hypothetical protein